MDIDSVISALTEPDLDGISRRKLLIKLCMWIRFSQKSHILKNALMSSSSRYLSNKFPGMKINKLDQENLEFFEDIDISQISEMFSGLVFDVPDFESQEWKFYSSNLSEFEYIANILKFILWFDPVRQKGRKPHVRENASLNKAHLYMHLYGFDKRHIMSRRKFGAMWSNYVRASGFIYVSNAHFSDDYILNPNDENFSEKLDRISDDFSYTEKFLGMSASAYHLLDQKLHTRAKVGLVFPSFPARLKREQLPTEHLPDVVAARVADRAFEYDPEERDEYITSLLGPLES